MIQEKVGFFFYIGQALSHYTCPKRITRLISLHLKARTFPTEFGFFCFVVRPKTLHIMIAFFISFDLINNMVTVSPVIRFMSSVNIISPHLIWT